MIKIGVYHRNKIDKFEVSFSRKGKTIYIGTFCSFEEANKKNKEFLKNEFDKNLEELGINLEEIKETNIKGYYVSLKGHILNEFGEALKGFTDRCGYQEVIIKGKTYLLHRLILSTFKPIENYKKFDVNHIDGNKLNNKTNNLEWATRSENIIHSFQNGLQDNVTNKYGNKKIIPIYEFEKLKLSGCSVKEIAEKLGCCEKTVRNKLNGKRNV